MTQLPPELQLMRLANAFQLSRAVQVAARLGLGRLLADGGRDVAALAAATGTDPGALRRLLRFLAELGVVAELGDGRFGPTPLSARLHLVDNVAQGEEAWAAWGALPEALRTGGPAFPMVHGASFYDYTARHPEQEANWIAWNAAVAGPFAAQVAAALELEGSETVVDVGGGEGGLLAAILRRHPGCRGVLLELPGVAARAEGTLVRAGVRDRATVAAGDAFAEVPPGGDVYILSRVLQTLGDAQALRLLARCRQALAGRGVLKVVERLMPEPGDPRRRSLAGSDLNHFLLWGGGHRTRDEMAALLAAAGLDLERVGAVADGNSDGWQMLTGVPRAAGPAP